MQGRYPYNAPSGSLASLPKTTGFVNAKTLQDQADPGPSLSMDNNPLLLAIRHISDAKRILQDLNTSWENFDYAAAANAVKELDAKVKALAQLEAGADRQGAPLHPNGKKVEYYPEPQPVTPS